MTPYYIRSKWFGCVVVVLAALGLMWLKHSDWMQAPNRYIFGESADGFKNYLTAAFHIERDRHPVHYEGMNYPFGEHVLFTDNQPLLSTALQIWHKNVAPLTGMSVGIMNTFQLLSMLLGAAVLFLLLFRLRLPVWYAGAGALGMLFLSPQYNRFDGHFGLSHVWIFPLLLYLLLRYEARGGNWKDTLPIAVLIWAAAQLHFYYFGLSALFLGLYTLVVGLQERAVAHWARRGGHLFLMAIVPFVLLNLWVRASDYVPDRPSYPYGFTTYIGYWEGILLPYEHFPLYKWVDQHLIKIRRVDWETQAFAGMLALFFFLWALVKGFRLFGQKTNEDVDAERLLHRRFIQNTFTAALLLTLFACGFPYAIKGMGWMVDMMGPLRQFRGLARFTWSFYYVMNVAALYVVWQKSLVQRRVWVRWALRLLPILFLSYDAWEFQGAKHLQLSPNIANKAIAAASPDHWLNKVDFSAYQGLLPLPYYHVGSENIWIDPHSALFRKVQTTALHTGVPDMGVMMSRSPIGRMLHSVQLVKEPCQAPSLLEQLPDKRPIALMVEPSRWNEVQDKYGYLLKKAVAVYDGPDLKIFSLAPDSLYSVAAELSDKIVSEMETKPLYPDGEWMNTSAQKHFYYEALDSLSGAPHTFRGKGALHGWMSDTTWIFNGVLPKDYYYVNLWIYVKDDMAMTHELKIYQNDPKDGREINMKHEGLRFYLTTIVDGWALFDVPFEVFENGTVTRMFLQKKGVKMPFCADEILIKPSDITLYRKADGWVSRNNFWYQRSAAPISPSNSPR